jgi:hypothetical protein
MFDPRPANVGKAGLDGAPARASRAPWRLGKLFLALSAIGIGGVALLIGLGFGAAVFWTLPRGPQVLTLSGTVVRLEAKKTFNLQSRGRETVVYAPIVRFTAPDGKKREFEGRLATQPSPWAVGQTVRVLYDPVAGRPELIGWEVWSIAVELSAAGAAAVAMGVVLWRRRWWTRPGLW